MKLKRKVAVVTGAGRGLGRAVALALSGEGASVAAISRTGRDLESLSKEITSRGGECLVFAGDVSNETDVLGFINRALERFSRIDILVNNAAVIGPARFVEDVDSNAWEKTININLIGAFYCCRAVVPVMASAGGGKIISLSSGLGQMPYPRFSAYAVSKAGVIQLTRSLAEELKPLNIRVNALDPGVMDTGMQQAIRELGPSILGEEIHRRFAEYKSRGYLKDPARVARLVVFLASDESAPLSGRIGTADDYVRLGWRP